MNPIERLVRTGLVLVLAVISIVIPSDHQAQAQSGGGVQGPFLGQPVEPALMTKDLRTLPKPAPAQEGQNDSLDLAPERVSPLPSTPNGPDPIRQTQVSGVDAPRPVQNFDGAASICCDPPDANGAAGIKYYVQMINLDVGFFDKATGFGPIVSLNTFWQNAGTPTGTPCDANHHGDPVALYDQQADRYLISDFAYTDSVNGPFYECIAVSQTSDPISGGWYLYPILADNHAFNDYPKLGVWPDAYYMTANMQAPLWEPRVWALNRAKMIAGGPLVANDIQSFNLPSSYFSVVPSNFQGTPPPAGRPAYFGMADRNSSNSTIHIFRFHVDFATPANSWFGTSSGNSNPTDIAVSTYNDPTQNIPQKGTVVKIGTQGDRLMYQLQYRNINGVESLWAVQQVDAGGGINGIRWYQLNVTADVIVGVPAQQSTFSPDATHRFLPHLAVDRFGNMAIGYNAGDSSIYPEIRYTGRLATDPADTLQAEARLFSSLNYRNNDIPTQATRWGDYSSMEVDPVDDCTFWFTTEYIDMLGNDATRIGSFSFPPCETTILQAKRASTLAANLGVAASQLPIIAAEASIIQISSAHVFMPLIVR